MKLAKKDNIYIATVITGHRNNILGICFADEGYNSTGNNNNIEVIEWKFPNTDNVSIGTSKAQLLKQVVAGLDSINEILGTNYRLSKVYYVPSEYGAGSIYQTFTRELIKHYYERKEFETINFSPETRT